MAKCWVVISRVPANLYTVNKYEGEYYVKHSVLGVSTTKYTEIA